MSSPKPFSFIRRVSQVGTRLHTFLSGEEIGRDEFGNRYYRQRGKPRPSKGGCVRQKRWVIYAGEPEPTKIPSEWHIWLHYTADTPLPNTARKTWQKPHSNNKTGTPEAWMPPSLEGKERFRATGETQAWNT